LNPPHDLFDVLFRLTQRKLPQEIISAEKYDNQTGIVAQDVTVQTLQAVLRGISAPACIDHRVGELARQERGVILSFAGAHSLGETISETHDILVPRIEITNITKVTA
jgi:hypothetical protein